MGIRTTDDFSNNSMMIKMLLKQQMASTGFHQTRHKHPLSSSLSLISSLGVRIQLPWRWDGIPINARLHPDINIPTTLDIQELALACIEQELKSCCSWWEASLHLLRVQTSIWPPSLQLMQLSWRCCCSVVHVAVFFPFWVCCRLKATVGGEF